MKKLSLVLISIFSVLLCGLLTACGKTFEVKFTEGDCIVAVGEEINLDSYLENESVDYSNKVSKLGDSLTSSIEVFVTKSSKVIMEILKSLF